jgi:superfamily II DNA or RNA helicase
MENNKRDEIQQEALDIAKKHLRTGLGISVGVGKTRIGLMHMVHLNNNDTSMFTKFLVVAPKKAIFESWKKEAEDTGNSELLDKIVFSTYRSINKHNPAEFSGVYLDECHNLLETHTPFLREYSGPILGLTGTPPRYKNSEKGKLLQVYCPIRYTYITDDAVEDNILNDYRIIIHTLELSNAKNYPVKNKKTGGVFYTSEVANYSYWNDRIMNSHYGKQQMMSRVMRMKAMMEYRSKEQYAINLLQMIDDKCIVFCNTTEQADRICDYSYHSKNADSVENLEKFGKGEIDELSCVLQLSEGINIPNLKSAIVLHAYGNEKKLMQRLGRLMRLGAGEKATIHILMYGGTQDVEWVDKALADLDQSKISYYN